MYIPTSQYIGILVILIGVYFVVGSLFSPVRGSKLLNVLGALLMALSSLAIFSLIFSSPSLSTSLTQPSKIKLVFFFYANLGLSMVFVLCHYFYSGRIFWESGIMGRVMLSLMSFCVAVVILLGSTFLSNSLSKPFLEELTNLCSLSGGLVFVGVWVYSYLLVGSFVLFLDKCSTRLSITFRDMPLGYKLRGAQYLGLLIIILVCWAPYHYAWYHHRDLSSPDEFGSLLLSAPQAIALGSLVVATIASLIRVGGPLWLCFLLLILVCFMPPFPQLSVLFSKNVFFTVLLFSFILLLRELIGGRMPLSSKHRTFVLYGLMVLNSVMLVFYNSIGVYLVLISCGLFLILIHRHRLFMGLLIVAVLSISLLSGNLYRVILPSASFETTLFNPALQQVAWISKVARQEVTEEDWGVIEPVISKRSLRSNFHPGGPETLLKYVKTDTTMEQVFDFYGLWWGFCTKYPSRCLEAFITSSIAYYAPIADPKEVINGAIKSRGKTVSPREPRLERMWSKDILELYSRLFSNVPLLGLITNIGFLNLLVGMLLFYSILRRNSEGTVLVMPLFLYTLSNTLVPSVGSLEVGIPVLFCFPLGLLYVLTIKSQDQWGGEHRKGVKGLDIMG
jgi:hypothetical protein